MDYNVIETSVVIRLMAEVLGQLVDSPDREVGREGESHRLHNGGCAVLSRHVVLRTERWVACPKYYFRPAWRRVVKTLRVNKYHEPRVSQVVDPNINS